MSLHPVNRATSLQPFPWITSTARSCTAVLPSPTYLQSPRLTHNLHLNCNSLCNSQPNDFYVSLWRRCTRVFFFLCSVTKHSWAHLLYFTTAWFSGAVRGDKWFIFLSVHYSCSTLPELFPLSTLCDLQYVGMYFGGSFNALLLGPGVDDRIWMQDFSCTKQSSCEHVVRLWIMQLSSCAAPWFQMELRCIPKHNQHDY